MLGRAMFYGRGAGKLPTASAVASDIIDIATNLDKAPRPLHWEVACDADVADLSDYACRNVFILNKAPAAGLAAELNATQTVTLDGRTALLTPAMTEADADRIAAEAGDTFVKRYRVL